jgi:hypothetical protein
MNGQKTLDRANRRHQHPEMPSVDAQHKKAIILLASSTQQKFITFSSGRRTMRSRQRDPIQSTRGKACTGKEFGIPPSRQQD